MSKAHSESEFRGMITTAQKQVEEITLHLIREGYPQAAFSTGEAAKELQEAKHRVVMDAVTKV